MTHVTISQSYDLAAAKLKSTTETGRAAEIQARNAAMGAMLDKVDEPIEAFTLLASYFAGQQYRKMEEKISEYDKKVSEYERVLNASKKAHVYLAEAKAQEGKDKSWPECDGAFRSDMNWVMQGSGKTMNDISGDNKLDDKEAQACVDAINHKKDMISTELQGLSTEVDMAVKDQGEAEQMAANAVKKLTDLISTLGKTAGG